MNSPIVTIVVPCYNEESVLQETISQLCGLMRGWSMKTLFPVKVKFCLSMMGARIKLGRSFTKKRLIMNMFAG